MSNLPDMEQVFANDPQALKEYLEWCNEQTMKELEKLEKDNGKRSA